MPTQPDWEKAYVPEDKILGYLLDVRPDKGGDKAVYFAQQGFTRSRWKEMAQALVGHARRHQATRISPSPFGLRYIVEGPFGTPRGNLVLIRSLWFVEDGSSASRLVTAYPFRRPRQ